MLSQGYRVLAVARRKLKKSTIDFSDADGIETDLEFLGLFGIVDPPRPEAAAAMDLARSAGIRIVMITGDAGGTAQAIARSVGMPAEKVLTGPDIDALDDAALIDIDTPEALDQLRTES